MSRPTVSHWLSAITTESRLPFLLASRYIEQTGEPLERSSMGGTIGPTNEMLYLIVRATRPEVVVETGVAAGFTTAYILQGLHDNGIGRLVSIDLPTTDEGGRVNEDGITDKAHVPASDLTGFVVPPSLRDRWELHLGDSKILLPVVLERFSSVDLFLHDSAHSYLHMLGEYRTTWPRISKGGWLVSDDIDANQAFDDFTREVGVRALLWEHGRRGALRHP